MASAYPGQPGDELLHIPTLPLGHNLVVQFEEGCRVHAEVHANGWPLTLILVLRALLAPTPPSRTPRPTPTTSAAVVALSISIAVGAKEITFIIKGPCINPAIDKVLSVPEYNYAIGFALLMDYNSQLLPCHNYENGRFLFKKYLEYEKSQGDEGRIEHAVPTGCHVSSSADDTMSAPVGTSNADCPYAQVSRRRAPAAEWPCGDYASDQVAAAATQPEPLQSLVVIVLQFLSLLNAVFYMATSARHPPPSSIGASSVSPAS
ncbi:hypothetical protein GUJ93_ZPchr0013g36037 [Zizania palustris]|uniref:Rrp5 OB-fold domain-containing protein n=1 Tax=Zizania palustris TaxID=103762 RepID=A0A8J5X2F0_ZIZPA|nr:hypothetical protein GUJ93_ZPchr0013g36037 [Zizania palustris]